MVPLNDGMNLVGLMLVRNEDWVIGASLRAALDWCDHVVVWYDRCTDQTLNLACNIAKDHLPVGRVLHMRDEAKPDDPWNEMNVRHQMLEAGRNICKGTHFAIVDGDEILTANLLSSVRGFFRDLLPGQLLELPMVPVWRGLDLYRDDNSVWSSAKLTIGWADKLGMGWAPREDGYQHHNRAPYGALEERSRPVIKSDGGVMHLQFANRPRLLAKHVLYRMVDHLRWPGRRSVARLNSIYDEALGEPDKLSIVPLDWWGRYRKDLIELQGIPWQQAEIVRLLLLHGREAFAGLDLKGY